MARTQAVKNYKNFLKGYLTEGNEFDEVDGAIRDGLNVIIERTGGLRRRYGIDFENGDTAHYEDVGSGSADISWTTHVHEWNSAGGNSDNNFTVVQVGLTLLFYSKGQTSTLAANYVGSVALSAYTHYPTYATQAPLQKVQMSTLNGVLYVVGKAINPTIVQYDGTTPFTATSFQVSYRDFQGDLVDSSLLPGNYDANYWPTNFAVDSISGAFTDGEEVHGSSGTVFNIFKCTASTGTGTILISTYTSLPVVGETITGVTSGATAHISTGSVQYTSYKNYQGAVQQNLYNQGWSFADISTYVVAENYLPTHTQISSAGKNSSGTFDPPTLLQNNFGNSPAPRGKVLMNLVQPNDRQPYDTDSTYATSRLSVIGAGFGRVFFGGYDSDQFSNWIFFSPILDDVPLPTSFGITASQYQVGQCYQTNDPTSDYANALLATDGGTIVVPDMGKLQAIRFVNNAMYLFALNGVWAITGASSTVGFTADSYNVKRICSFGTDCPESIVIINDEAIYWTQSGIISIAPGTVPGTYVVSDLVKESILSYFSSLRSADKQNAVGYYDQYNHMIRWAFVSGWVNGSPNLRQSELVLDTKLKAFYPPIQFGDVDNNYGSSVTGYPAIAGYTQDSLVSYTTGFPTLKYVTVALDAGSSGTSRVQFAELRDDTFTDWTNVAVYKYAFSSFAQVWPDHVGDPIRDKQPKWVYFFFKKTEDGFEDNGSGGLIAKHQSSCLVTAKYQWHITATAGKWSGSFQAYKYQRPYVPVDVNDTYDTGESVLVTKIRFKGRGKALTLRIESEANKDFQLLGFSIPYTAVFTT